jgi:hypothetical protein
LEADKQQQQQQAAAAAASGSHIVQYDMPHHREPPPTSEPWQLSDMLTNSDVNADIVTLALTPSQSKAATSPWNTTRPVQDTRLLLAGAVTARECPTTIEAMRATNSEREHMRANIGAGGTRRGGVRRLWLLKRAVEEMFHCEEGESRRPYDQGGLPQAYHTRACVFRRRVELLKSKNLLPVLLFLVIIFLRRTSSSAFSLLCLPLGSSCFCTLLLYIYIYIYIYT